MECKMRNIRSKGNNRERTMVESVNSSSSSSNPNLPMDVVTIILAMLSSAALQRFRCVCKSWDSLVQGDRHLASLHLAYSQQRSRGTKLPPLVSLSRFHRQLDHSDTQYPLRYRFAHTLSYSLGDDPARTLNLGEPFLGGGGFTITNSCDGLIGICGVKTFYIVNPSIRKVAALPRGSPHKWIMHEPPAAGLGFDASTGEYKVVRLFHRGVTDPFNVGCEVISLGGNETRSWRLIDDPPDGAFHDHLPVVVNGAIYWHRKRSLQTGLIGLYFDLSREKFGGIAHPDRSSCGVLSMTELGGCLCAAIRETYPSKRMSLWFLKDPTNSIWVKQYEIDLGQISKQIKGIFRLEPLTIHNGKIVIHNGKGKRDYYDPCTGRYSEQDQIAEVHFEYVCPYTESIVWPW